MTAVRFGIDTRQWDSLLDAMKYPNEETTAALAVAGAETFDYLQNRVPEDTGRLKASGRYSIDIEDRDSFVATSTWGGPTPAGYPNPSNTEFEISYAPQAFYHARTFEGYESTFEQFEDAMFASLRAWRP